MRSGDRSFTREEDWDCPQCKVSNFGNRTECFRCGLAKGSKPEDRVPEVNYVDDYRAQLEALFAQQFAATEAVGEVIDDVLDKVIGTSIISSGEAEEDSAEVAAALQYKCLICNFQNEEKFEVYEHLEEVHKKEEDEFDFFVETVDSNVETNASDNVTGEHCSREEAKIDNVAVSSNDVPDPDQEHLASMDNDERKVADCDEDANIEDPGNMLNDVTEKSVDTDDYIAPDSPDYNPPMDLDDDEEEMKPTIDSFAPHVDMEADDDVTEVNNSQEASPADDKAAETELHAVSQSSQKAAEAEMADDLAVGGSKASECATPFFNFGDGEKVIESKKESVVEEAQVKDLIDGTNVEDETATEGPNLEIENVSKEVSIDGTIELGSSLDAEEETSLSPETTSSTRSNSPVMVNTVEELKKVLVRDDKFKFVVNEEVQKTEEFKNFMAEKIQNAKKDD